MVRFRDGVTFDPFGPLRLEERPDGLYVVGCGYLAPVASHKEAKRRMAQIRRTRVQIAQSRAAELERMRHPFAGF